MKAKIDAFGESNRPVLTLMPETGAEWALLARASKAGDGDTPGEWDGALAFEMEISAEAVEARWWDEDGRSRALDAPADIATLLDGESSSSTRPTARTTS